MYAENVVYEFEQKLCEYTKAPFCVCVDSCSHALFLSLKLFNSTKVTCPKNTYFSVPMQILHAGFDLVFEHIKWTNCYRLNPLPIWDAATLFLEGMYNLFNDEIVCISFQYKKPLFINKGGAILLNNEDQYNRLKSLSFDGRPYENNQYKKVSDITDVKELGYHYAMSPESAAQGLLQFDRRQSLTANHYYDYKDCSQFSCFKDVK